MDSKLIKIIVTIILFAILSPLLMVLLSWLGGYDNIWQHFYHYLLEDLIIQTFILVIGVGLGVAILGTTLAYLIVMVDFPGRKYLEFALFLPFAIPAYVLAFIYLGIFDYSGYFQEFMREYFAMPGFDVRSGYLAIIITFVMAFYPYVYMLARSLFKRQKKNMLETSSLLGASNLRCFFKISVPLVRPAIAAGVLLTTMEVLADFGVVSLFNYDTFTTAIYSAWIDFRSIKTASQLSSLLVLIAMLLIYFENKTRADSKYYSAEVLDYRYYKPKKTTSWLVSIFVWFIFAISFLIPVMQLIYWSVTELVTGFDITKYIAITIKSLMLVTIATLLIMLISIILVLHNYHKNNLFTTLTAKFATLGYALPGSVMVVGLLLAINAISKFNIYLGGSSINHIFFGSIYLLIFAYISRFLAIGYNSLSSSVEQIKPVFIESANLLGSLTTRTILKVQLPMVLPGIIAGSLLVAVDILKELPATYLLRPTNWNTLAVNIYELSSDALFAEASIPSLIIISLGVLFIFFAKRLEKNLL